MKIEPNNIYLGNSYELIKDIPDKSVDLIITDPPYEIEGIHGSGIMKDRYGNQWNFATQIKNNDLDKGIDLMILREWVRVMKKINIYIWCNKQQILQYTDFFVKELGCNWELLIWAKDNPIAFCGTHYLVDKEYCLYFWEEGAKVHIPFERAKTFYISHTNIEDKKKYGHPTIKPLEFIKKLILNSSERGGVILDTFLGSGTTAVAAKETGRQYIGFEINEEYFKIAKDRINGIDKNGQMSLFYTEFEQLDLFNEGEENEK